jgi:hypothetical protein
MNQTRDTNEQLWQGTMAALLLVLVLFSDAIVGAEPERAVNAMPQCDRCVSMAAAGLP